MGTPGDLTEIEHKFVMDDDFDLEAFRRTMLALGPQRTTALQVQDTYYLLENRPHHVYRHRHDAELQHLTVKSWGGDPEVRVEINIDLGQHRGNQQQVVEAFLDTVGVAWRGYIHKDIEVFYYPDCEVVHYRAWTETQHIRCVEFEALHKDTLEQALGILRRYQEKSGFAGRQREQRALIDLLFPELPAVRSVAAARAQRLTE